ncbi:hypothetical protein AAFF_G00032610 [Aldrovandia affinis]|uniref:Uncharacterized protein n=1 Tax=Aldrovandia affinis TaxID=143900 RepID=A0AAD7S4A9_9TELE|nr:hypothetical protein AAFF_G00032610 [Aldrovandia affinis]
MRLRDAVSSLEQPAETNHILHGGGGRPKTVTSEHRTLPGSLPPGAKFGLRFFPETPLVRLAVPMETQEGGGRVLCPAGTPGWKVTDPAPESRGRLGSVSVNCLLL